MIQNYSIQNYVDAENFRMGIGGFYPNRVKRTFLVNLVTIFIYFVTFSQMLVEINLVCSISDISKISEVFLYAMTQIAFINKLISFHWHSHELSVLDEIISQDIFNKVTQKERQILDRDFATGQRPLSIFYILCIAITFLYGTVPLYEHFTTGVKAYPFPARFPFNPDNYYYIIFIAEILTVAVGGWNNGTMDGLFAKHATIATSLFVILRMKINNLFKEDPELTVEKKIRHCIIYYIELIRYVSAIQNLFSYGVLIQFACSAIVICLTGFQLLIVSSEGSQIGRLAVYLTCMTVQLVVYCWRGHMLTHESDAVTAACYNVDWVMMTVKERKLLFMIMERAKRPITLRAAGIFTLNFATLTTILRSSYSYFAVLQQIYKD